MCRTLRPPCIVQSCTTSSMSIVFPFFTLCFRVCVVIIHGVCLRVNRFLKKMQNLRQILKMFVYKGN
jgi:hypothetical protein